MRNTRPNTEYQPVRRGVGRGGTLKTLFAGLAAVLALNAYAVADDLYTQIAHYDFDKSRAAQASLEVKLREGGPAERGEIEKGLLRVLTAPDATFAGKQFACQTLRRIGSEKSVPVVAKLLTDEKLSHMARWAIDGIPGDAAFEALLAAMRSTSGALKVGLIGSLGNRGDQRAVPELAKLVSGDDAQVARAAIQALGGIGGDRAADALERSKTPADLEACRMDAYLRCLKTMAASGKQGSAGKFYRKVFDGSDKPRVRIAALRGIVSVEKDEAVPLLLDLIEGKDAALATAALTLMVEIPGKRVTSKVVDRLPKLTPQAQAAVLGVLAARSDEAADCKTVNALASSKDSAVRAAALQCLGTMGDASNTGVLLDAMAEGGETGKAARDSLDRLRGPGIDQRIMARMPAAAEALRVELIQSLAARRAVGAAPALLELASGEAGPVRNAALKALGDVANDNALPRLYRLLKERADDTFVEQAVYAACVRRPNRDGCVEAIVAALSGADTRARTAMLHIVTRLGGKKALAVVTGALDDRGEDIQNVAMTALTNWSDTDDLASLLAFARSAGDQRHRVSALQGCIRLMGLPNQRSPARTVELYRGILELPMQPAEKKNIFRALGWVQHQDALKIVIAGLDDQQCGTEAADAVVKLAEALKRSHPALVKSGLKKVLATTKDDKLKELATEILRQ